MRTEEAKYLEDYDSIERDFEMFTRQGNKRCQAITRKAIKKIFGDKRITKDELATFIGKEMKKVAVKFSEIHDTEPPYHIELYIKEACEIANYSFELDDVRCFR